jgi:hypothetical protein
MDRDLADSYLITCKNAYLSGVYPFNLNFTNTNHYRRLRDIASQIDLKDFIGYLMEYQYYINLWTSYFILEDFKPNIDQKLIGMNDKLSIVDDCIETVERYRSGFEKAEQIDNCRIWLDKIKSHYAIG